MITYTFEKEDGGSVRATGWRMIGATRGFGDHLKGWQTRAGREKQENVKEPKFRWEITKNRIKRTSNPVAKDLFTPLYRLRVVKNKKKYRRANVDKRVKPITEEA